jgi:GT2 family glycosyltransferase
MTSIANPASIVLKLGDPPRVGIRDQQRAKFDIGLARFLLRFPLVDGSFILHQRAGGDTSEKDPVALYFERPPRARPNPHILFDRSYYFRQAETLLSPDQDEFFHYLSVGDKNDLKPHVLFTPAFYRKLHPTPGEDVPTLADFLAGGYLRGGDPHPLFSCSWYVETYLERDWSVNPLVHYLEKGAHAGYAPHPLFDPKWYLSQTTDPDAQENPLVHYVVKGSAEGLTPHPLFNPSWFMRTQITPERTIDEPLSYFLGTRACWELDPNPLFSTRWYLQMNPDVEESGLIPIVHYLLYGAAERRDPHPAFSTAEYLSIHANSLEAQRNPLVDALQRDRLGVGGISISVTVSAFQPPSTVSNSISSELSAVPFNRRPLANVLCSHASERCAARVASYFDIVDHLEIGIPTSTLTRKEKLERIRMHLKQLLEGRAALHAPQVSIIVPCYNHIEYTIACVLSILEHTSIASYEVIIANDISTDETKDFFEGLGELVRCITHATNGGFILNCNRTALHARGTYLALLNNDTFVIDGWLDELLAPFERFKDVGYVGSKLLNSDGSLQEAGAIIWKDGSGWNFGRNGDPLSPEYNYVKDVDYCSGASIIVPRKLWQELGGFDERYLPAYYDDSDLAFEVRAKGFRTLYSPRSVVVHHEGVSHGKDLDSGIKAYQAENQKKFVSKWKMALESENLESGKSVFVARDRSQSKAHMLVVDHYVPQFDRDAGSRLVFEHCKMFVDAGMRVTFWPDNLFYDQTYVRTLEALGIEVIHGNRYVNGFRDWIRENGEHIDYAFLSRAHVAEKYVAAIRDATDARVLFCGHDLHMWRLQKEFELTKNENLLPEIEYWTNAERRMWEASDVIYYPGLEEREYVQSVMPGKKARLMCVYIYTDEELDTAKQEIFARKKSNDEKTIIFVAGFRHRPNVDGGKWLVTEVMPRVRAQVPDACCMLVGSYPPPEITALEANNVIVTGFVSDTVLRRLYDSSTVAVAPLRFGGGIQGKILDGLKFGIPIVTTSSGAEGMPNSERFLEIADGSEAFARSISKLLVDQERRRALSLEGNRFLRNNYAYSIVARYLSQDIPELAPLADGNGCLLKSNFRR